jgi:hypothetical protein
MEESERQRQKERQIHFMEKNTCSSNCINKNAMLKNVLVVKAEKASK